MKQPTFFFLYQISPKVKFTIKFLSLKRSHGRLELANSTRVAPNQSTDEIGTPKTQAEDRRELIFDGGETVPWIWQ